ncbi:hypothetical protein ADUPG1_003564, partial [Aduncisulcus paluster]
MGGVYEDGIFGGLERSYLAVTVLIVTGGDLFDQLCHICGLAHVFELFESPAGTFFEIGIKEEFAGGLRENDCPHVSSFGNEG